MAAQQIEGTLAAVKTKLQTNLATYVATVNADVTGDDYAIETAASDNIHIGVRADIVAFPSVFVTPVDSYPEHDGGTRIIWVHRVRVLSCYADFTEEALAMRLLRFQRAVRECLLAGRIPSVSASTTAGFALRHIRDSYSPVFSESDPNQGDFSQMCESLFEVRQQQDLA